MDISQIRKPTILINEAIARENIFFMAEKARKAGVIFRPHFKTHQSATIGEWFREAGVERITVSSVTMCRFFASQGWSDITIAFPANPREIEAINEIAGRIRLNLIATGFEHLASFAWNFSGEAGLYIKIDTGYRRSGVDWNRYGDLVRIIDLAEETGSLRIRGLLTHSGHTYSAKDSMHVLSIFEDTRTKMLHTKEILPEHNLSISIGDTPSCSLAPDFKGIDEIRPGNFVFYDLMQTAIGSCHPGQIALSVACPVVSVYRDRKEAIIYGGAVHLSKEFLPMEDNTRNYGLVVSLDKKGWYTDSVIGHVRSVSQEHGIVALSENGGDKLTSGDLVAVIPVHSCLTADLLRSYTTLDGREINDLSGK
ncbi:MAG: alanine racemase [Bacteroidales bacterium]|jgi:D-serine deaminase-like pyridoxal phosphate-dependent protein|nr:alanine racemase [Bacteroidales bacterium]